MTIGNLEYRVPLALPDSRGNRRLGGALFYDTGNVFERPSDFTLKEFTHTAGAGLRFVIRDPKGTARAPVLYHGTVPDLFQSGRDVLVEGRMQNGVFVAVPGSLMTKCPSKYSPKKS